LQDLEYAFFVDGLLHRLLTFIVQNWFRMLFNVVSLIAFRFIPSLASFS